MPLTSVWDMESAKTADIQMRDAAILQWTAEN